MTSNQTNPVRAKELKRRFDFASDPFVSSGSKIVVVKLSSDGSSSWNAIVEKSGFDFEELPPDDVENLRQADWDSVDVLIVSPSVSFANSAVDLVLQEVENPPQIILLKSNVKKEESESLGGNDGSILELSPPFDQSLNAFLVGLRNSHRPKKNQSDLIGRKKVEADLRESEERFELVIEGTGDSVWDLNVETEECYWSPQLFELLEYDEGKVTPSLHLFRSRLHTEDLQHVVESLERHLKEDVPYNVEFRYRMKNGGFRWMQSIGRAVRNSSGKPLRVVGSMRDISERKRAEFALTKSREQYRQLLEHLADGVVVVIDGHMQYTNRNFSKIAGYDRNEMVGMAMQQLLPKEFRETFKMRTTKMLEGEILPPAEYKICTKSGSIIPVEISSCSVYYQGQKALLGIIRDITKRKQTQKIVRKNRETLAKTSLILTLTELASGVIHEMSQPLTAITTLSFVCNKLLLESTIDPLVKERFSHLFGKIETQSLRAGSIIQNLKKIVLKSAPKITEVDVNQSLNKALDLLKSTFQKNNVKFQIVFEDDLSTIRGDDVQVEQIFMNILLNSIDILSSLQRERVVEIQTMSLPDDRVGISISDNGTGIPQNDMLRIFDPFFSSNPEKMGLGLSICKSIVEAHEGKISARNNEKRGMTISVTFPTTRK